MKISASVRAAMVPDDKPMHPDFTSIYLIGPKKGQSLTIDSGEAMERYKWMLRGYLAATEKAEIAIAAITHHHSDHCGNLKWMQEQLKADIAIARRRARTAQRALARESRHASDGDVSTWTAA